MATATAHHSSRFVSLQRTLAATFEALKEHSKSRPDEVAELFDAIAAHVRSASPQSLLVDTGPVAKFDLSDEPVAFDGVAISRALSDGCSYRFEKIDDSRVVTLHDAQGDDAVVAMSPNQLRLFIEDARSVL